MVIYIISCFDENCYIFFILLPQYQFLILDHHQNIQELCIVDYIWNILWTKIIVI